MVIIKVLELKKLLLKKVVLYMEVRLLKLVQIIEKIIFIKILNNHKMDKIHIKHHLIRKK